MAKIINKVVHGGPVLKIPADMSVGQYVIDKLREYCDEENRIALINGETGEKITYRQILEDVVNLGTGLKKHGIRRGDVVAICSENRIEYIVAALAVICCGATVTTVSVNYTKDELLHTLNISRPNIIMGSQEGLKLNLGVLKSIPYIKKIVQFDGTPLENGIIPFKSLAVSANVREYEPEEVRASDTVFILYSSGTTGLPKGVMLSQLNVLYMTSIFDRSEAFNEDYQRMMTIAPWYHAYGLLSTIGYICIRRCMIYFASFQPLTYLNAIQEYKAQVLLMVPPLVVFMAKSPLLDNYDLSSVNIIWCGAAPLSADTISAALKRFKNCQNILQAYGMTETSLVATKDLDILGKEGFKSKPGSGGTPMNGVKLKVVDLETRQKLGPYQNGEVCLKGPIIMKGYMGNEAATIDTIDEEGYLKTGDIGYYDDDGYIFIVDRLKELIKYKGHQVPPALVENVLLQHPGVAECGVAGTPHESAGELPTAFVVLKLNVKVTEKELLDFTASKLSPEKRLHGGIVFVNEIPKNPSGKILRRLLKQKLQEKQKSKL